jgi:hypothetical protein
VGGLAVTIWGAPRMTKDIDFLVQPEDLERAKTVARDCGFRFEALLMKFDDGMEVQRVTKIEGEQHLVLDLLLVNPNLAAVFESRRAVQTDAGTVWVVSREQLIKMKLAAGRPQDLFDAQKLIEQDR